MHAVLELWSLKKVWLKSQTNDLSYYFGFTFSLHYTILYSWKKGTKCEPFYCQFYFLNVLLVSIKQIRKIVVGCCTGTGWLLIPSL